MIDGPQEPSAVSGHQFQTNSLPESAGGRFNAFAARIGEFRSGLLISLACFTLSLFLIFPIQPAYVLLGGRMDPNTFGDLTFMSRFYFSYLPISEDPAIRTRPHYLFTRHRILAPVIAHYTGLAGRKSVLIPLIANFLLLWAIYAALRKRKLPPDLCTLVTAALSLTLIIATSQAWAGYQDSLGCLAIALALCTRSVPLSAVAFFIGMLAEERIIAAAPLFVLWHALEENDLHWLRRAILRSAAAALALGAWLAYLYFLHHRLSITMKDVTSIAFDDFRQFKSYLWPGFYYGLRAAWILPTMLLATWFFTKGKRWPALLIGASILAIFAVSLRVGDISRVCCFAFPAVLIAAVWLHRTNAVAARYYAIAAFALNLVTPCVSITQDQMRFFYPLPLAIPELIHQLHHPG